MTTATPAPTEQIDLIVTRLGDIAKELHGDRRNPVLAEVREAASAAERAFVLLSPWEPHPDDIEAERINEAIARFIERTDGIPMPPDEHFVNSKVEQSVLDGANYARVTMEGCVYLVIGEADVADGSDGPTSVTMWSVEGRYPQ